MKHTTQSGYILVLTLLIMSVTIMIVMQIFQQSSMQHFFDKTALEREQAKKLAYSGLALAFSTLSIPKEDEKKSVPPADQKEEKPAKPKDKNLTLLQKIIPVLNQAQTYELKKDIDGIDGSITVCITAEEGKLNINNAFDFKKKEFAGTPEIKKGIQALFAGIKAIVQKDLYAPFEKFLKQRTEPLFDVTELLSIKEFQDYFKQSIFYDAHQAQNEQKNNILFLTDLFTIDSTSNTINPWLFSYSTSMLLGVNALYKKNQAERKKELEELLKEVTLTSDTQKVWDQYLSKIYGKEFKALPKDFVPLLSTGLSFKFFTILSYGTIGNITQKLAALIERIDDMQFLIKKIYWI